MVLRSHLGVAPARPADAHHPRRLGSVDNLLDGRRDPQLARSDGVVGSPPVRRSKGRRVGAHLARQRLTGTTIGGRHSLFRGEAGVSGALSVGRDKMAPQWLSRRPDITMSSRSLIPQSASRPVVGDSNMRLTGDNRPIIRNWAGARNGADARRRDHRGFGRIAGLDKSAVEGDRNDLARNRGLAQTIRYRTRMVIESSPIRLPRNQPVCIP